ncbi:MAG: DUF3489 domain-containing protein [Parvibaculaceae bacterium]
MSKTQSDSISSADELLVVTAAVPRQVRSTNREAKAPSAALKSVSTTAQVSKSEQVLKLLRRKKGASLAEMQEATGWQAHSVRGFLSGTVKKRMGLPLQSEQSEKGGRRYLIAAS